MPKLSPKVSVMMPVLNEGKHLRAAVESVLAQKYDGDIELILALGPSRDGTNELAADLARADERIRLIENPRGLTTVGLNLAIAASDAEVIARIDAHSEPSENYLATAVEVLHAKQAALVGGVMAAKGRSIIQRAVAWAYTSRFGIGGAAYHVGGQAGVAESAYLGVFAAQTLKNVGGYNESIIRGEDWELAQRIKKAGGLVWFDPRLQVTYWPRGRVNLLAKQFYSTGVWRGDLTRRDFAGASKRYFLPPALVGVIFAGLVQLSLDNYLGILPIAGYLLAIAALASTAVGLGLKERVALLFVLPTMHISWGLGFWIGFIFGARGTLDRSRV